MQQVTSCNGTVKSRSWMSMTAVKGITISHQVSYGAARISNKKGEHKYLNVEA